MDKETDKLSCVLIDDETHCTESLQWMLDQYCPALNVAGVFNDPVDALAFLRSKEVDLIFLDIEMPGLNAFDLLISLGKMKGRVIFTTAYDEFALKAIKHNALDYLLKPIDKDDLLKAVAKAHDERSSSREATLRAKTMSSEMGGVKRFALSTKEGYELIEFDEICYAKADDNYTEIHLCNGERKVVSRTLKSVEEELQDERFFRLHQSYLVSLPCVAKYNRGSGGSVLMHSKKELPVSRGKKDELLAKLGIG